MSKMIDGDRLVMTLTDWWYSSFGLEETDQSNAIKEVINEVEKYVTDEHENMTKAETIAEANKVDTEQIRCETCASFSRPLWCEAWRQETRGSYFCTFWLPIDGVEALDKRMAERREE